MAELSGSSNSFGLKNVQTISLEARLAISPILILNYNLEFIFLGWHICMVWDIEYTDEFEGWWDELDAKEQSSVSASVDLLGLFGPGLRFPHSSDIKGSRHGNLRELRIQHAGRPYRVLYAFDPRRCAVLLIGGDKTSQNRWYEEHVPIADKLYGVHLETLRKEGRKHG